MERLKSITRGWEVKQKIATPVIANLTSALILFVIAVLFKPLIMDLFSKKKEIKEYPVYCVVEPYTDDKGQVVGDLFVSNLLVETFERETLRVLTKTLNPDPERVLDPDILVRTKSGPDVITEIKVDSSFNDDKGEVSVTPPDQNHNYWRISINRIEGNGILKLTIFSTTHRSLTRSAKASAPFEISYPREPLF